MADSIILYQSHGRIAISFFAAADLTEGPRMGYSIKRNPYAGRVQNGTSNCIFYRFSHEKRTKSRDKAAEVDEIRRDIEERDRRDMNREISPLRQAEDAVLVDSSDMTVEEVIEKIASLARK